MKWRDDVAVGRTSGLTWRHNEAKRGMGVCQKNGRVCRACASTCLHVERPPKHCRRLVAQTGSTPATAERSASDEFDRGVGCSIWSWEA